MKFGRGERVVKCRPEHEAQDFAEPVVFLWATDRRMLKFEAFGYRR